MPVLCEETPGAEGGSTPQPAAGIRAFFSPLQGKDTQTPDFSWAPRKESVTSFVAASDADAVDLSAAPRVIKVKDHLRARVDEIECYIRVDKKARTAGMFHVALCKQSYAENSGQKPRAMKGKGALQMSAADIKLAIGSL